MASSFAGLLSRMSPTPQDIPGGQANLPYLESAANTSPGNERQSMSNSNHRAELSSSDGRVYGLVEGGDHNLEHSSSISMYGRQQQRAATVAGATVSQNSFSKLSRLASAISENAILDSKERRRRLAAKLLSVNSRAPSHTVDEIDPLNMEGSSSASPSVSETALLFSNSRWDSVVRRVPPEQTQADQPPRQRSSIRTTAMMNSTHRMNLKAMPPPMPPASGVSLTASLTNLYDEEDDLPIPGTWLTMARQTPQHIVTDVPTCEPFSSTAQRIPKELGKQNHISRRRYSAEGFPYKVYDSLGSVYPYEGKAVSRGLKESIPPWYKLSSQEDDTLVFDARFECGNLRKAIRASADEYDLYLRNDIHTEGHTQWYYFSIKNVRPERHYRFNIVNLYKSDSLYNHGLLPLVYSTVEATKHNRGWFRSGTSVCYFANTIKRKKKGQDGTFYTLTFELQFPHGNDVVYLAHCYPYHYSQMQKHLRMLCNDPFRKQFIRRRVLTRTLAGNKCDVLTITDPEGQRGARLGMVISARIHPGETNASWMMHGLLEFLTGPSPMAHALRKKAVIRIIPMLGVDGVINGNYRCSLSGQDLNRRWAHPTDSHPTIIATKKLLAMTGKERPLVLFVDLHGHSARKNVFMYGCDALSWKSDSSGPGPGPLHERCFPWLLASVSGIFDFRSSSFKVKKSKEGTGRVVGWKQFNLANSFTLEASFAGANFGPLRGLHFDTCALQGMGESLGVAMAVAWCSDVSVPSSLPRSVQARLEQPEHLPDIALEDPEQFNVSSSTMISSTSATNEGNDGPPPRSTVIRTIVMKAILSELSDLVLRSIVIGELGLQLDQESLDEDEQCAREQRIAEAIKMKNREDVDLAMLNASSIILPPPIVHSEEDGDLAAQSDDAGGSDGGSDYSSSDDDALKVVPSASGDAKKKKKKKSKTKIKTARASPKADQGTITSLLEPSLTTSSKVNGIKRGKPPLPADKAGKPSPKLRSSCNPVSKQPSRKDSRSPSPAQLLKSISSSSVKNSFGDTDLLEPSEGTKQAKQLPVNVDSALPESIGMSPRFGGKSLNSESDNANAESHGLALAEAAAGTAIVSGTWRKRLNAHLMREGRSVAPEGRSQVASAPERSLRPGKLSKDRSGSARRDINKLKMRTPRRGHLEPMPPTSARSEASAPRGRHSLASTTPGAINATNTVPAQETSDMLARRSASVNDFHQTEENQNIGSGMSQKSHAVSFGEQEDVNHAVENGSHPKGNSKSSGSGHTERHLTGSSRQVRNVMHRSARNQAPITYHQQDAAHGAVDETNKKLSVVTVEWMT